MDTTMSVLCLNPAHITTHAPQHVAKMRLHSVVWAEACSRVVRIGMLSNMLGIVGYGLVWRTRGGGGVGGGGGGGGGKGSYT